MSADIGRQFEVETAVLDGHAVLRLRGELDMDAAGRLGEAIEDVHAQAVPVLLLDLSELEFIDSSGLRELVVASRRQQELGGRVELHAPSDPIRRVLEIVGLDQILTISESPLGLDPAGP